MSDFLFNKFLRGISICLSMLAIMIPWSHLTAQVNVINPETMYNGTGGINGDAIGTWEINDRFENDGLLMSGTGDMRNTSSSAYTGASGTWNVMLNSVGEHFTISGINALEYSNLQLSLGIRKPTLTEDGSNLLAECSSDGITWTNLSMTLPTGPGTAGWHFVQVIGSLPACPSLYLRFTSLSTTEFRLDDINLKGMLPCSTTITSFIPSTGPAGTQVKISGSGFTGAVEVLFNGITASYFQVLSDGEIVAVVPPGPGSGQVSVVTNCLMTSSGIFELISSSCAYNGSNLLLSELCDPVNNYETDRFIELFNPTSQSVDLSGWSIRAIANYTECETWNLSGIIHPGEALTCGFTAPINGGPPDFMLPAWNSSIVGSCCSFWNGNRRDGAALYDGPVKIDEALFEDNPVAWFTDRSLVRQDTICDPNPIGNPTEWTVTASVVVSGGPPSSPGTHTTHCPGIAPAILAQPVPQLVCDGSNVILSVSAVGGSSPFQFQWMVYDSAGGWQSVQASFPYAVNVTGSGSTLTISDIPYVFDQNQYYCLVSTSGGGCYTASMVATVTIIPLPATSSIFHY